MPVELNNMHFSAAEINSAKSMLASLHALFLSKSSNLTPAERQQYASVKEQNKLFIHKVRDYRNEQPAMSSPDVDWNEFEADFQDRNFLEDILRELKVLAEIAGDAKIMHDYDVYQAALTDYDYTKYKTGTHSPGFDVKHEDLKSFFGPGNRSPRKTGSTNENADPETGPET